MVQEHDSNRCAAAWLSMRRVHAHVSTLLETELRDQYGLTQSEFDTLLALYMTDEKPSPISTISASIDLSQPALSRLLVRLEDRGWIARSRSDTDARQVLLSLTPAGCDLTAHAIATQANVIHTCMSTKLSDADQQMLVEVLARITPLPSAPTATHSPSNRTGDRRQTPHP
jgi:DNA-binding MarR family transcriptional regulator